MVETVTAICILGLICSGIMAVMSRCTTTVDNLTLRVQAFEVARQQMEEILAKPSVQESVDMGTSERYPAVQWQTTVEVFQEPIEGSSWARAVCSTQYQDADGEAQTVELTCWLGRLTADQLAKLERERTQDANDPIVDGVAAAAEYAGVTPEIIQTWVANGLVVSEDGAFFKANLDLYKRASGRPSDADKQRQIRSMEGQGAEQPETADTGDTRSQTTGAARPDTPTRGSGTGRITERSSR
jgi:hypothetical protein